MAFPFCDKKLHQIELEYNTMTYVVKICKILSTPKENEMLLRLINKLCEPF